MLYTTLQGQLERITYTNEEDHFTIGRLKVTGQRELATIVGNLVGVSPGEVLRLTGEWVSHPRFGRQFKVASYESILPGTAAGIERYLGSGLIRGIGPVMARRLVHHFGVNTLEVIEQEREKLREVEGIGPVRMRLIAEAWQEQREIRNVMVFLQGHGVSPAYSARIYKHYGERSIAVVQENPYRLATDIDGIGFITADRIAQNLGVPRDALMRAEAGLLYVLQQLADEGHVYYPQGPLLDRAQAILEIDIEIIARALAESARQGRVVIEVGMPAAVYLPPFHVAECGIAQRLKTICAYPKGIPPINLERAIQWVEGQLHLTLAPRQIEAIRHAILDKVMVITGGPGTGKSTIVRAIVAIYRQLRQRVLLAAPTGRAAKRLAELTGCECKTIHRLLEYSFTQGGFQRGTGRLLEGEVLIVDEASMIDIILMYHLLKAVSAETTLILVGDANQLPSVGPGNVLKDIIASSCAPVIELTEIFRQARASLITRNAHAINRGEFPILPKVATPTPVEPPGGSFQAEGLDRLPQSDFIFIAKEEPEQILSTILDLCRRLIPQRFRLHPLDDIQVLTPMNRGLIGTANLNAELQRHLNPGHGLGDSHGELSRAGRLFRVNDKVMQIRNDYDKDVYNGDIGRIARIDKERQQVMVTYEGRLVRYDYGELEEIVLAYAISVHKSQGSEYPAVIIPITTQHYILLQRNLLYTAITRGRRLVVLIGTVKALAIAIKNDNVQQRYTMLQQRLASGISRP